MVYSLQRFEFMWLRPTNLTNKSDDQCADETRPDTHFMGATIRRWLHGAIVWFCNNLQQL